MEELRKSNPNLENDDFDISKAESMFDLSFTQARVSYYIAMGLSRLEIADQMQIGEETVKTHTSQIYRRVGKSLHLQVNNSNLRNIFIDNNILTPPTNED